jgi:hypothetical protein
MGLIGSELKRGHKLLQIEEMLGRASLSARFDRYIAGAIDGTCSELTLADPLTLIVTGTDNGGTPGADSRVLEF